MRKALSLLAFLIACSRTGDGPVAVAYDKEPCGYCHMLIGEPKFAAQLITEDGDVLDFDDPGCLLRYVAEQHPHTRAIWFRDSQRDRWLAARDARFVHVPTSPMGWGYAAVDAATPNALTFEAASDLVERSVKVAR